MGNLSDLYPKVATWITQMVSTIGGWLVAVLMAAAAVWIVRLEARLRRLEGGARRRREP